MNYMKHLKTIVILINKDKEASIRVLFLYTKILYLQWKGGLCLDGLNKGFASINTKSIMTIKKMVIRCAV